MTPSHKYSTATADTATSQSDIPTPIYFVGKDESTAIVPSKHPTLSQEFQALFRDLWRDGNGWILLTVGAGWFLSIGVRYVYPSLIPFLRSAFDFDLAVAGLLLSALWFAYAFGQFPGGVLGDRIGEGNILAISTAISTFAVLLVAGAFNIWVLFIGTIAFGFASALYGTTRFTIFTDLYSSRAGTAVGFTMAAGSIGNTVLPAAAVAVAAYATWRLGFGMVVPLFIGITGAIWYVVPARTSGVRNQTNPLSVQNGRQVIGAVTAGGIPLVVGIHIVLAFVSHGFLGFYPTYLIDVKGFSPQLAAVLFGLYFAAGIVIQPLVGMAKDRFGSRLTLTIISGAFFAGLLAVQLGSSVIHFVLLTVLISHRNGLGVVTNTYIADALPEEIKGSGLGFLRTIWQFTGATSPILVGYLGSLGRLDYAFLVLAGIAAIATVLAIAVPGESERVTSVA